MCADVYSGDLLDWLCMQSSWPARKCTAQDAEILLKLLSPHFQKYSGAEMAALLRQYRKSDFIAYIATAAFLGKQSILRDAYELHEDRSSKSRMRVAKLRDGKAGLAKAIAREALSAIPKTLSALFEGLFMRHSSRAIRRTRDGLADQNRQLEEQLAVMTTALLIVEKRLDDLEQRLSEKDEDERPG